MLVMIKAILYEKNSSGVCEYGHRERFGKILALRLEVTAGGLGGGRRL